MQVVLGGSRSRGRNVEKWGGVDENGRSDGDGGYENGVGDDIGWVDDEVDKDGVHECERDGVGGDKSRMEGALECADDGEGAIGRRGCGYLDGTKGS